MVAVCDIKIMLELLNLEKIINCSSVYTFTGLFLDFEFCQDG